MYLFNFQSLHPKQINKTLKTQCATESERIKEREQEKKINREDSR